MRKTIMAASIAFLALGGVASAQTTVITQDPAVTNSTVVVPGEVRTYVTEQSVDSVPYDGDVVIGRVLPGAVEVRPVQGYDNYGYTVINQHRVIVDPQTRTVVQVLD